MWICSEGLGNVKELQYIQSSLTRFVAGYETLRTPQFLCKIGLAEASVGPSLNEQAAERLVSRPKCVSAHT